MTISHHTPGPWKQDWQFIVAPDPAGIHPDIYIAEIAEDDEEGRIAPPAQRTANGQLIVAAPEMLAALRLAQQALNAVPSFGVGATNSYRIASQVDRAVALTTVGRSPDEAVNALPAATRPYSVLLLYPDYMDDFGHETFYAFVEAPNPLTAVAVARQQAVAAQSVEIDDPTDFYPLLVTEGHRRSEPLFNK